MRKTVLAGLALAVAVLGGTSLLASRHADTLSSLKVSEKSLATAQSVVPQGRMALKRILRADSIDSEVNVGTEGNTTDVVIDLLNGYFSYGNNGENFDGSTMTFPYTDSFYYANGMSEEGEFNWFSDGTGEYVFSGTVTCDSVGSVQPCILYVRDNSLYIAASTSVELTADNDLTAPFTVSVPGSSISTSYPMAIAFIVNETKEGASFVATDITFGHLLKANVATQWSAETDLPGLGLSDFDSSQCYITTCDDGATTIGLYDDGVSVYVTGINTTLSQVTLPENVLINGGLTPLNHLGCNYGSQLDWTGAPNLFTLRMPGINNFYCDFTGAPVTDLYISRDLENVASCDGLGNINLHIEYNMSRENYRYYGFKRVLVGEETEDYPVTTLSDWVIAGDNEGEYFGIAQTNDGFYALKEIFSPNDSVTAPAITPGPGGNYYWIRQLGYEDENYLTAHAQSTTTLVVPESYTQMYTYWSASTIRNLYMQGAPLTSLGYGLAEGINVYIPSQSLYASYESNSNWNCANLIPYGWEFEVLTVDVKRRGEFAQTYIEMTDADWSVGIYVKVTGELNATDLTNINNLTHLRTLDLSEAKFAELPSSFLEYKSTLREIILPASLTTIPSEAFSYCSSLNKVVAPGVISIGSQAFYNCRVLSELDITNVERIETSALQSCVQLKIPARLEKLKYIGSGAFSNTAVTEFELPEGIKTVPSSLFQNCSKLTKVVLPSTVTRIGYSAFSECRALKDINLPEGLTSIENEAFQTCNTLEELTLPSTLQTIGYDMLSNCTNLKIIKCKAIVPPTAESNFTYNMDMNHCTLYVAPFTIDAYREAENWSAFYIMKPLNEPVKYIEINRPMKFDLFSEDNAVLQENPDMDLIWSYNNRSYRYNVGQLTATGDGTLSAGVFRIAHQMYCRTQGSSDHRTSLINFADNMRADSVMCYLTLEKNYWHFISFQYDVQMADVRGINGTDFVVRQYNGEKRAAAESGVSNWENVPADGVLKAGKGYIVQAANNISDANGNTYDAQVVFPSRNTTSKNNLFTHNSVILPLEEHIAEFAQNRSWNLIGNPFPCYFDIHNLLDNFTAPITVWRGTSYQAYSPVDDDLILRPNEAFFVQRPLNAEQITFSADGRMHYDAAMNSGTTPGAKSAAAVSDLSRAVFNFTVEGMGCDDRARIVMNEDASIAYESDRDASKFFAEALESPELYVNAGVKYAICERPLADGTATLGLRAAAEGEYTLSLSGRNTEGWTVMLTDNLTGETVSLNDGAYTFSAKAGDNDARFTLTFTNTNEVSISDINAEGDAHVKVVSISGVVVYEGAASGFRAPAQGIYIVAGADKARKVVVK